MKRQAFFRYMRVGRGFGTDELETRLFENGCSNCRRFNPLSHRVCRNMHDAMSNRISILGESDNVILFDR